MRVAGLLFGVGVLFFSHSSASALGCKDLPGAVVDRDLNVMSTNFGRLLPDRKSIKKQRTQKNTLTVERLVATRIVTRDGSARADVVLKSDSSIAVSGVIDGQNFTRTSGAGLAGLGFKGSVEKLTTALKNIGRPLKAFEAPQISSGLQLGNLSRDSVKILTEQHKRSIKGTNRQEKTTVLKYSCTGNAEYAGDPTVLKSMVVLRGVVKATTITKTITFIRSLDITMVDVAKYQTVSRQRFLSILAPLPGIGDLVKAPEIAEPKLTAQAPVKRSVAVEPVIEKVIVESKAFEPIKVPEEKSVLMEIVDFFSLAKPGTWILLLVGALLSTLVMLRNRKNPVIIKEITRQEPEAKVEAKVDVKVIEKTKAEPVPVIPKEPRQEKLDVALQEQVLALKSEKETLDERSQEMREENLKLKTRLDKAEALSRDLSSKVIELQTSSDLMDNRLDGDKSSVAILEQKNQQLLGINDGYREKVEEVEAEYTALMHKLDLRERAVADAETRNNHMHNANEEVNHAFSQEQKARSSLEAEFNRLLKDYDTLWAQSSGRMAHFREETASYTGEIRQLRDEILSLDAALESVHGDRDGLKREFQVLGDEHARKSAEYKVAIGDLESRLERLHMDLTAHRRVLAENRIRMPEMGRLSGRSGGQRDTRSREFSRREVLGREHEDSDNVVRMPRRSVENSE